MKLSKEDILEARNKTGLNQEQFADLLMISESYLAKLETGAVPISPKSEIKLQIKLRQIVSKFEGKQSMAEDEQAVYATKHSPPNKPIPYYDVDVMLTPIEVFNDQTTVPAYEIDMPGFSDCAFAINVFGHSMYPTIESGTIVFCKEIKDKSLIIPGEVYFIVTDDYRMVKRILKSEKVNHVIASSDNHNGHDNPDGRTYGSVDIPLSKIRKLYIVKGNVKRNSI